MWLDKLKPVFILFAFLIFGVVKADYLYDYKGMIDKISKDVMILNDISFRVSKLADCYDHKGRKLVGCSGLNVGDSVGVFVESPELGGQQTVTEIRKLSK